MKTPPRYGFWNTSPQAVIVRSGRGFTNEISLVAVTMPNGETLQLAIDDAKALADALQREIARVRGG